MPLAPEYSLWSTRKPSTGNMSAFRNFGQSGMFGTVAADQRMAMSPTAIPRMNPAQRAESYGILADLQRFNQGWQQRAQARSGIPGIMATVAAAPAMVAGRAAGGYVPFSGYANPQAMAASQYGGLNLRQGTSPSGASRPGFYYEQPMGAAGGIGWDAAAAQAVARNPALSRTATGGVAGSPNPNFAPPTMEELAANRAAYQAQRANTAASRQAGVQANAVARADQRRIRSGNLTMEERMNLGIPGYAVERERASAVRDVGLANADAVSGRYTADNEFRNRELAFKEREYNMRIADNLEAQADEAEAAGDYTKAGELRAKAGKRLGLAGDTVGIPTKAAGPMKQMPAAVRQQLANDFANDPQGLAIELGRRGMSPNEINREMNRILGVQYGSVGDPEGYGNFFRGEYADQNSGRMQNSPLGLFGQWAADMLLPPAPAPAGLNPDVYRRQTAQARR